MFQWELIPVSTNAKLDHVVSIIVPTPRVVEVSMADMLSPCVEVPASRFGLVERPRTGEFGEDRASGRHWAVDYSSKNAEGVLEPRDFLAGYRGKAWAIPGSAWNTICLEVHGPNGRPNGVVLKFLHASKVGVPIGYENRTKVQPWTVLGRTGDTSPVAVPVHLHLQAEWKGFLIHPDCALSPKQSTKHKRDAKDEQTDSKNAALRTPMTAKRWAVVAFGAATLLWTSGVVDIGKVRHVISPSAVNQFDGTYLGPCGFTDRLTMFDGRVEEIPAVAVGGCAVTVRGGRVTGALLGELDSSGTFTGTAGLDVPVSAVFSTSAAFTVSWKELNKTRWMTVQKQ